MTTRILALTTCLLAVASAVHAQPSPRAPQAPQPGQAPQAPRLAIPPPPPAPPAPAQPPQAPAPRREGQPINIKVELTLTDQRPGAAPIKKTVSVVAGDNMSGFIRTQATYRLAGINTDVPLNIDVEPTLIADGKIRLRLNLQYDLPTLDVLKSDATTVGPPQKTQIHENLGLILESGKSIVASQSVDPVNDRQVIVEVKATILK